MNDPRAVPADHVLKPLELRMLEMSSDMGPLMVQGGNFVAALRVFAEHHPGLIELVCCDCGGPVAPGKLRAKFPEVICPACAQEAE